MLAHSVTHLFSRSQLKLSTFFELAGVLEQSKPLQGSMPKSRQSLAGGTVPGPAIPYAKGARESWKQGRRDIWEEISTEMAQNTGKIIIISPLFKYFFKH